MRRMIFRPSEDERLWRGYLRRRGAQKRREMEAMMLEADAMTAARQALGSLTDPLEVAILTDHQVRSWTERHYSGGWAQFLVDFKEQSA